MLANRMRMGGKKTYDSFTKSLLHFDGVNGSTTFTDEIGRIWTPNVNAKLSSTSPKFGSASGIFDGSSWIDTPNAVDFNLGSGDFTFDLWFKRSNTTFGHLYGQTDTAGNNSNSSTRLYIDGSNFLNCAITDGTASSSITSSTAITDTTTWHHVAVVRSGSTLYLFQDGIQVGSVSVTLIVNNPPYKFSIGRFGEWATTNYFYGNIDEFRFSKGIARWTANFTPPTAPY